MAVLLSSFIAGFHTAHAHAPGVKLSVIGEHGEQLLSIRLRSTDRWCLLWNHSVAGFLVSDCFINQHTQMLLHSSHQPDFAAGLGHLEGRGTLTSHDQGGYLINHINEPIPGNSLTLRVGSLAVNHRLVHEGKEISLSEVAAGRRVTLRLTES